MERISPKDAGAALATLRAGLQASGYSADALQRRLGITFPDDIGLLNHAPALARLAGDRAALATVIRLFFLEADQPERRVAAAFGRRGLRQLLDAGVVRQQTAGISAQVRVEPVGAQFVIADRRFRALAARALGLPGRDPVYPPSSDSLLLRDAVVAPGARRILDLCTGSGVQALQTVGADAAAVAVDVNPRAVALARLNAQLNGIDTIDVRRGDLYAPVAAERFDLIIANPPFVASPYTDGPAYHAGGTAGDRVLRRIIAGWSAHLQPGGRAFAISHLALRAGQEVGEVAASWFRGFDGNALVLVLERGSAVDLAAAQALFALRGGLAAYAREVQRWVDHLGRRRLHTIVLLLIAAQRGAARGCEVVEAQSRILPIPLTPSPADRLAQWFAAQQT